MPAYQIHRMKDHHRQHFRWAPHTSGVTVAKPKDYDPGTAVEAASPYAVWLMLRESEQALRVGDLLETENGELRIYKYIGFEESRWFVAEPPPVSTGEPSPAAPPPAPAEVT